MKLLEQAMEYRLKYWVQLQPPLGINMFPPHSFVKMPACLGRPSGLVCGLTTVYSTRPRQRAPWLKYRLRSRAGA